MTTAVLEFDPHWMRHHVVPQCMPQLREVRVPKWAVIADAIRGDIQSGRLKVGDKLPGNQTLRTTYGVADRTVRQALRSLAEDGLIRIDWGKQPQVIATPTEGRPARADIEERLDDHERRLRALEEGQ